MLCLTISNALLKSRKIPQEKFDMSFEITDEVRSVIKLSVSIFGQTTEYWTQYIPETQYAVFGILK